MKFKEFLDKSDADANVPLHLRPSYKDERDYVTDIIMDIKNSGRHYELRKVDPADQTGLQQATRLVADEACKQIGDTQLELHSMFRKIAAELFRENMV